MSDQVGNQNVGFLMTWLKYFHFIYSDTSQSLSFELLCEKTCPLGFLHEPSFITSEGGLRLEFGFRKKRQKQRGSVVADLRCFHTAKSSFFHDMAHFLKVSNLSGG